MFYRFLLSFKLRDKTTHRISFHDVYFSFDVLFFFSSGICFFVFFWFSRIQRRRRPLKSHFTWSQAWRLGHSGIIETLPLIMRCTQFFTESVHTLALFLTFSSIQIRIKFFCFVLIFFFRLPPRIWKHELWISLNSFSSSL